MSEAKVLWVKQGKGDAARYVCNLLGHKLLIGVARNAGGRPDGYYLEIDGQYRGGARTAAEAKRKAAEALRKLVFPGAEPVTQERRRPTMTKHTPGPWQVNAGPNPWKILGTDGRLVAVHSERADDKEAEANARLIAAAPDLLAACRAVLADLCCGADGFWRAGPWADPSTAEGKGGKVEMLRAAVARAEGSP